MMCTMSSTVLMADKTGMNFFEPHQNKIYLFLFETKAL